MSKKLTIFLIVFFSAVVFSVTIHFLVGNNGNVTDNQVKEKTSANTGTSVTETASQTSELQQNVSESGFVPPLGRAQERVTKKTFGLHITRANSPVQPERFSGYHTGTDFEVFPEELIGTVSVKAVCDGTLILKKYASGYGGVVVEACNLDGSPITVIYGHLKLASIKQASGDSLKAGDTLGILGADKSRETDGERRHLHLGFHQGKAVNIAGYVAKSSALSDWLDPCLYVCRNAE